MGIGESRREHNADVQILNRAHLEQLVQRLERNTDRYIPDKEYVALLSSCNKFKDVESTRRIHEHIIRSKVGNPVFLCNHLIHTYGKCNALEEAFSTFDSMEYHNMHTYTALIGACSQHHQHFEAVFLFRCMLLEGIKPDNVTFLAVLTSCETSSALSEGKSIHEHITQSGYASDLILGNALINMYGSCGSVEYALKVFNNTVHKNVITWTAMIGAYVETGLHGEAFTLFHYMELDGVKPNYITYVTLVQACVKPELLTHAKAIHTRSLEASECEVPLSNALITVYGRCGAFEEAESVFYELPERDLIAWNALITEYSQHARTERMLEVYREMNLEGVKPDKVTFLALVSVPDGKKLDIGLLHGHILESGIKLNVALGTALVNMYSRYESLDNTQWVFEKMPDRNTVSYNVMVTAYAKRGMQEKTVEVTQHMQYEGLKPDNVTCVALLNVCTKQEDIALGRQVHSWMKEEGFILDPILANALLNMFGRCGRLEDAKSVFDKISEPNVISWTAMLTAYSRHDRHGSALMFFRMMLLKGVNPTSITFLEALSACVGRSELGAGKMINMCCIESGSHTDVLVGSALVAMYGRCGSVEEARMCFDSTETKNLVTWSAMIAAYVQHGQDREGLRHFKHMLLNGMEMSSATFASTLTACSSLACLEEGKRQHAYLLESGLEPTEGTVANALITMYGKCGVLHEARRIFESSLRHDIVSWNAIITAYAQHGDAQVSLELLRSMQQEGCITPDSITFVSILSVCSHVGMLEGVYAYANMLELGIVPTGDHEACVIDLLGRAGKLEDAEEFIDKRLPAFETVMSLLGSCRSQGDLERGRRAAERIMEFYPQSSSAHVVLSSIYSAAHKDTAPLETST